MVIHLDPGPFLIEALRSVQAQTYDDWEVVVVDDGSTDGSTELVERLAAQDPGRVRQVAHPGRANRGMSASRNLGVAEARGELVAFLDADDVYLPDKLRVQVDRLDAAPGADLVYGPMTLWTSWQPGGPPDRVRTLRVPVGRVLPPGELLVPWLTGRAPTPATCSVLLRRDAFLRVGGFEERFGGMFEDQAFFARAAVRLSCLAVPEPLDLYRQHAGSTSAQALARGDWHRERPNPARRAFLEWFDATTRDVQAHRPALRRAVRRELWPYRHPRLRGLADGVHGLAAGLRRRARVRSRLGLRHATGTTGDC